MQRHMHTNDSCGSSSWQWLCGRHNWGTCDVCALPWIVISAAWLHLIGCTNIAAAVEAVMLLDAAAPTNGRPAMCHRVVAANVVACCFRSNVLRGAQTVMVVAG